MDVKPVPEEYVYAIKNHVSRQVWAMVELQLLTGMRPGEVCRLRTCDLDTSGKVWLYNPPRHSASRRAYSA
jgi:integrase